MNISTQIIKTITNINYKSKMIMYYFPRMSLKSPISSKRSQPFLFCNSIHISLALAIINKHF